MSELLWTTTDHNLWFYAFWWLVAFVIIIALEIDLYARGSTR